MPNSSPSKPALWMEYSSADLDNPRRKVFVCFDDRLATVAEDVGFKVNTVDIFSDRDEMKRAVWQTEGVFKNSFTRRTTRDRGHGHLKSVAGTRQAAAQIYRRAASNDPGATRTCQLPESGSLWRLLRAHLLAPVSGSVSVARFPRQNASDRFA